MEILTSVVGKIIDYTFVSIGRQTSYLIFYKGNFKMLADDVKDLQDARERVFHLVEEERRNGKEIERDVVNWLEKVNEVIETANKLQQDPRRANVKCSTWGFPNLILRHQLNPRRANVKCSTWGFPNLILRHQLSRKAKKIANDVVQTKGKGTFNQVGYRPALDGVASSFSTRGSEIYETRESLKEDIVKALSNPNSCNIGIYGLGGVGKTTLVEEVKLTAKQLKLFDKVVITHVSQNPDFKTIQGEIADLLGLRFDEETIFGRANRLRQRIKMEKSILVILDNIWTMLDLKKVGIPFGNEHKGCKLLMTCRNQNVLVQMDVPNDFTFKLELMSKNETWNLFQFMAGDVVKDNNLKDIAFQVAQKCEEMDLTYSAFELSYNSLENDEMRDLFLLFALMEGGKVEYVLKVAMGLNILKHVNTMDEARNKLYTIIRSLEHVGINMYLRKQSGEEWPTNEFLNRCMQIVLQRCHIHELPHTIVCPNIKLFLLTSENRSLKIPDTFFEGMVSLRVLDLTYLNLSSLPTSFQLLTDLKTLCLDDCILENMAAIEGLQNLEILGIRKSYIIKFPREIGRLTQLRMLDLSNSGIEVLPSNIISSLINLEELYMGNTSINWEDVNSTVQDGNASIAELQKLPNLTALELQIRETWMLPRGMQLMFEKLIFFKIAIGDVWKWEDIEDATLKTLMLKLGTNIH
ncbi:hypothetical protein TSUD_398930 [Trifolium subterraneum]|uniref:NB-ARC domain-containing protein n=1 Tax=Trifolium subterraneum TaxID=3900 RepID=A0A2Z6NFH6_TRISU|nr:hypothetical protein TSUD_398930 [Trifolium subterraneum]